MSKQKIETFIQALSDLSRAHGVIVVGMCDCAGVIEVPENKRGEEFHYTVSYETCESGVIGSYLEWEAR